MKLLEEWINVIDIKQVVEAKWGISNKKYFEGLGYVFTKYGDTFKVAAKDLKKGSDVKVRVVCDYCNEEVIKTYRTYNKQVDNSAALGNNHKDCCRKCTPLKFKEFNSNKKTITKDTESLIVKDYKTGMTYADIKKKYKISENTLIRIRNDYDIKGRLNDWTEDKIMILKELYPSGDWSNMLERLHPFDKQAIHSKAYELNISSEEYFWSTEEEALLLEIYEDKSFDELLNIFPSRSESAIQSKARNLNIRKKTKWTENELMKLKSMYADYPNEMLAEFFPERNTNSIQDMGSILGIKKSENASNKYKEKVSVELLDKLKEFSVLLGRTPTSFEINGNPNMPGILTYHRYFETYSNACKLAGLEVNSSMFGRSFHLTSINGDVCLSKKEQVITNLLIEQDIDYQKEIMYKDVIDGYNEKRIRCDWLINDTIIVEYFGMSEREDYRIRMNEKIELCRTHDIPMISLYQEDIVNDFKGLISKFEEFDILVA